MSKFHKTLKNEFEIGEPYSLKGICYDSDIYSIDAQGIWHYKSVQIPNSIEVIYIRFEKGHLLFQQTSNQSPKNISIYGSMIRDNKVTISHGNQVFTTNGWI